MTIALMGGAALLLLLLAVAAVVLLRKRKPAQQAALEQPVEEPPRRRPVGASLAAAQPEVAAGSALIDLPPEPRRRVAIGLTPLDAGEAELVPAEADDLEIEEVESAVALVEPVTAPPPIAAFPLERPALIADEEAPPPPADGDEPPSILSQLKVKKKAGPNALSGAVEGAASSAPVGPSEIEEAVSLVLRRQVPPRDEAPRSWLGGLPMMPDGVDWPRAVSPERIDEGEVPLHFVAQIACADFPDDLWAGLGPRSGWLLLFLNPLDSQGDDPRLFRLLHTDALGDERQPPADIRPVVTEDLADGDYLWCAAPADIPTTWRRWPVDLVALPNDAHDDGYRISVTPKNFAPKLYEGANVAERRPDVSGEAPFSWRGALYVVDSILRELSQPPSGGSVGPGLREALDRPGFVASIIPELRAREQQWLTEDEGAILFKDEPLRERERELRDQIQPIAEQRQAALDRLAAFIVDHPNGASIARRVEADIKGEAAWRVAAAERLAAIRAQIVSRPLDSPLAPVDWSALRDDLAGQRHARWTVEWTSRNSDFPVMIVEEDRSLLDLAEAGLVAAVLDVAADYQGDPELRELIPSAVLDAIEPHWRSLTDNRPHRIGGFHDGLQSEPEDGPQSEVLLFQLASDEAMHWMWGDGGAYFLFISPRDLAAGRFDQAEIRLEQP